MPLGNSAKNGAEQPEDEQNGRRKFLRRAFIELPLIGLAVTTPIRKLISVSQRERPKAESVPNAAVSKYTVQILAAAHRLLDEKYQFDTAVYYEAAFFAGAAAGVELTIRRDQKLPPQETQSDKPPHRKLAELVNSCQNAILARRPFSKSRRLLFASAGTALLNGAIR